MFYQILISPQVNQCEIITYKLAIYDLPHKLPNDLIDKNWGNWEILGKCLNLIGWLPSAKPSCQNENFLVLAGKSTKKAIKLFLWCALSYRN